MTWKGINQTLGVIFQIFTGSKKPSEMGGVIRIGKMTADMAGHGFFVFTVFVALLSINIGVVNLLPIPMIDGGHLMFQFLEAVKGEPVSLRTKGYIYGVGLIFLFLCMIFINVRDIMDLFIKK